jgi:putative cell wall-binding protein
VWPNRALRAVSPALAAVTAIGMLATTAGASTGPTAKLDGASTFAWTRLGGADRYATAAAITGAEGLTAPISTAIVASGTQFPDALAASELAGVDKAPILLTGPSTLSAETATELAALRPANIIVAGGPLAVSGAVVAALGARSSVQRIGGANRYATAADLAEAAGPPRQVGGQPTAIIATADTFADALSAAPVSYAAHLPILLVGTVSPGTPTVLPAETAAALTSLHITQVIILGGTYAVPTRVEEQINALGAATLVRLAGADRTVTSDLIAEWALTNLGFDPTGVVLARGDVFPDALGAGPFAGGNHPADAGSSGVALLLTKGPDTLGEGPTMFLSAHAATLTHGWLLGATDAISDQIAQQAAQLVNAGSP